jgi:hypothetical protein
MQNDEYSDGRTEVKYPPLPIHTLGHWGMSVTVFRGF